MDLLYPDPLSMSVTGLIAFLGKAFLLSLARDFGRYLIAGAFAFFLLWVWLRGRLLHRRIQDRFPDRAQLRREFLWSVSSVLIYAVIGMAITIAVVQGWTRLYFDFADYGWLYAAASLALMIVLHDAYFYWTHRAMHHPRLFRVFHKVHHKSHNPSPWAAYSFAPAEAVVQALFVPVMLFVLPLHPLAIFVWALHQILRNVFGHSGFEIFPRGFARHPVGRWITTHTHHDLHHSKLVGNYGLYFTWWDRWMGTLREDYEETFDRVTTRPARSNASPGVDASPARATRT